MTDVMLRVIIRLSVAAAVVVLLVMWHLFRANKRNKIVIIALFSAVGLVFALNEWGGKFIDKIYNPEMRKRLQATADFIEDNRDRIGAAEQRINALETLVSQADWLPEGELTGKGTGPIPLLLWTHSLRGYESPDFPDATDDLWVLDEMVRMAADPESIEVLPIEWMTKTLDEVDAPFVIVAQLNEVVRPNADAAEFGKTTFSVAVVDMNTGSIVAHGGGEATGVKAAPNLLMENLWTATNTSARALAKRLMPAAE